MCGIVGYSGIDNAVVPVIDGLSRLEYRGYDSAGISIQTLDGIKVYKKEGKLENLERLLEKDLPTSNIAIGHTRWATHGRVNDTNAHPHVTETFAMVHNGIIENANEIREELKKEGIKFLSDTDSEVFVALVTLLRKTCSDTAEAIRKAFARIKGNSAFVIMEKDSHLLYAIKRSAPLVCGTSDRKSDILVSSDPYALVSYSTQIYFPEDNVLCIGDYTQEGKQFSFYELDGSESTRYLFQNKMMASDVVTKGGYEHFMLKEIHEQPALIRKLAKVYLEGQGREKLEKLAQSNHPNVIHIVACGTALHAGMVIKSFLEKFNSIRALTDYASEFRYRNPVLAENELSLFISQSGETADTLACQELCASKGLKSFSIVNVEGSTLFRNCTENILIHAGIEIGVASTKAFTQQVLCGLLLSKAFSNELGSVDLKEEFSQLAKCIEDILQRSEEIQKIARSVYHLKGFIFTGRGEQFPIALEGALKLKEIAYVHAEGYAAGELKHGPISLIDENMVNIAIVTPDLYEKTLSNAEEVRARRGIMLVIGERNQSELESISDYYFGVHLSNLKMTAPIATNVVLQLLSYYIAKLKGTDIDKPRNLAKSVTVE